MADEAALLLRFSQSPSGAIIADGATLTRLLRTAIPSYQLHSDRHPFIPVASPSECCSVGTQACLQLLRALSATATQPPLLLAASPPRIHSASELQYVELFWPAAQIARSKLGLSRTVFHIKLETNSANQYEAVPQLGFLHHSADVNFLLKHARASMNIARQHPSVVEDILHVTRLLSTQVSSRLVRRQLAEIRFVALARQDPKNESILREANALVQADLTHPTSYLHRAHALCCAMQHWPAVLDIWYALLVLNQHPNLDSRAVTLLVRCIPYVPFVGLHVLYSLIPVDTAHMLQSPYHSLLWPNLSQSQRERYFHILNLVRTQYNATPRLSSNGPELYDLTKYAAHTWLHQSTSDKFAPVRLPHLFSWVVPFRLAGSMPPSSQSQFTALKSIGFTLIVNTTMKRRRQSMRVTSSLQTLYLPVPQFGQPIFAQIDAFVVQVAAQRMTLVYRIDGESITSSFMVIWVMICGCLNNATLCADCFKAVKENDTTELFVGCCRNINCALVTREPSMSAFEAIQFIRGHRPCSIDEKLINSYYTELWRRFNVLKERDGHLNVHEIVFPRKVSNIHKNADLEVLGRPMTQLPSLIVLCGLPGSGKSYFASKLSQLDEKVFIVACQDILGSRQACASTVSGATKNQGCRCAIVDRCNLSLQDRMTWLDCAFRPKNAVIVYMSLPIDSCIASAESRINHPTLVPGAAAGVINSLAKKLQPPGGEDLLSGFQTVYVVRGSHSFEMLLSRMRGLLRERAAKVSSRPPLAATVGTVLSPYNPIVEPSNSEAAVSVVRSQGDSSKLQVENHKNRPERLTNFFKFPRTKHLFNLGGSVGDDDIVMSNEQVAEMASFFNLARERGDMVLTVEEKVDGANLGFSMCSLNGDILVQNRSHYVNSKSHPQFKLVGHFVRTYEDDIRRVLRGGQRVLYGEWMYFKHSIPYSNLPSVFLAFDLFDTLERKFLSRLAFRRELMGTRICMVEQFSLPEDMSPAALTTLVANCRSNYYDGPAEGFYIRLDKDGWLYDRAKVVRPGFIVGNEHWTRRNYQRNKFHSL